MLQVISSNEGMKGLLKCDDEGEPVAVKMEGHLPDFHFTIDDGGASGCTETSYIVKLRGHDVLMWAYKGKNKGKALVLPRNENGF